MQEHSNISDVKSPSFKSRFSKIVMIFFAVISALLVLFSILVCSAAFSSKNENTAQLFGYKFFYSENDIEGTDIKGGSLIVIKNSDNDDFYKADFLSQNAVLVIEDLGYALKENGFFMALCIMIPFMFAFLAILVWEVRKLYYSRLQKPVDIEFIKIPEEEFVCED